MGAERSTLPGGIGLVEVSGSLLGGDEINRLRNAVNDSINAQSDKLIIDFSKVSYMNSSAIGVLASAVVSYSRRGWKLRLSGLNKEVYSILAITKLNLVLEASKSREEAIRSFT